MSHVGSRFTRHTDVAWILILVSHREKREMPLIEIAPEPGAPHSAPQTPGVQTEIGQMMIE